MTKRQRIMISILGISIVVLLILEINDHFYSLMLFAEPAVPLADNAVCKRLVSYKPFWRERVYAINLSEESDWLTYYYAGDQRQIKSKVQECERMSNQKRRGLYY